VRIHTFTIVVGSMACDAQCPYCVSKMTPSVGMEQRPPQMNWRNLRVACRVAKDCGVSTALITGKGEPSLFPTDLVATTKELAQYFGFVELQTNGIRLIRLQESQGILSSLYDAGMTTICLSVAHYDAERSREIICPKIPDFNYWETVEYLHKLGFSVRVNCTLTKAFGHMQEIWELVSMARAFKVEQLTVRNVTKPDDCEDLDVQEWIEQNKSLINLEELAIYLCDNGGAKEVLRLPHGAVVFDVEGQNLCVNNCLTESSDPNDIRQLIFMPDGGLFYSWQYTGARLL